MSKVSKRQKSDKPAPKSLDWQRFGAVESQRPFPGKGLRLLPAPCSLLPAPSQRPFPGKGLRLSASSVQDSMSCLRDLFRERGYDVDYVFSLSLEERLRDLFRERGYDSYISKFTFFNDSLRDLFRERGYDQLDLTLCGTMQSLRDLFRERGYDLLLVQVKKSIRSQGPFLGKGLRQCHPYF